MGKIMAGMAWLVIMAMLTLYFSDLMEDRKNPNRNLTAQYGEAGQPEVVLKRNRMGHYVANGSINDVPVTFLLDTGATGVALSPELAQRAGVTRGQPVMTRTANGSVRGYLTRLDSVRLGAIEQFGVQATVSPGLGEEQVLLGMSFLKHLEMIQKGDTLTLRQ